MTRRRYPRHEEGWDAIWSGGGYGGAARLTTRARGKVDALAAAGLDLGAPGRVLDAACGAGTCFMEAAARGPLAARWVLCDRSAVAAGRAWAGLRQHGLDAPVLTSDVAELPFRPGSFDVVLASMLFQHLGDPSRAVSEIERVLVAGGTLFVVVPNRYSLGSVTNMVRKVLGLAPYDLRRYTAAQLLAVLQPRFDVEVSRRWHVGPDRPIIAAADRALGAILPGWGRYLVARARKRT